MNAVREDFRQRASELLVYLHHVVQVTESAQTDRQKALGRSLRAATYLVTYNLIEATARNTVRAVFDRLGGEAVSFDVLSLQLKRLLLAHAKLRSSDQLAVSFGSIATDIVTKVFDPSVLFAGNVDAKKLRETAKKVGYRPNWSTQSVAATLLTVKTHRNDLAHGNKSFDEIGRDATVTDLRNHVAGAIRYMREVMRNVEQFLANREYLA
jgi:hypothetical protein